jgi:hypothetical protein
VFPECEARDAEGSHSPSRGIPLETAGHTAVVDMASAAWYISVLTRRSIWRRAYSEGGVAAHHLAKPPDHAGPPARNSVLTGLARRLAHGTEVDRRLDLFAHRERHFYK